MADTSSNYHEPVDRLSKTTLEHHRALVTLMEELEAVEGSIARLEERHGDGGQQPDEGSLGIGDLRS